MILFSLQVYTRRWYILATFSLINGMQCLIWDTFGPIANSIKYAYDWNDSTIAMMANWGTITFIIIVFPFCWIMETKGWYTIQHAFFQLRYLQKLKSI